MHLRHVSTYGRLPTSTFELVRPEDGAVVGLPQLRHRPSAGVGVPPEGANHVYYEISETERRRGYGTKLLELVKQEAVKLGLQKIYVACFEDNEPSRKIIDGGVLVYETKAMGTRFLKFEIDLSD